MADDARPHILLLHADQHRADCLGCYGHPFLKTPNLDRLAAGGVRFTRAYTPCPVCVPARNSLLYGCWPTRHRVIANPDTESPRPVTDPGLPTFSGMLRHAGYRLGYVGKWHVSPQSDPTAYGFHEYVNEWSYHKWREGRGLPPSPRTGGWLGEVDPHIAPEQSRLAWGADHVIRMLEEGAATGAPLFVRWDPSEPHLPNVVPEPYASLYDPADIPPWPNFADPLEGKPYIQAQMRRTWGTDGWTWDDWAPLVARYFGEVSLLDAQVGRILNVLDRLGLTENTLVVYSADHGDMTGSHGMLDKHYIFYEEAARVPLIARGPGVAAGAVCDAFVTHGLDLAATFCAAAGVPAPDTFQGESLLPLLAAPDGAEDRREDIYAQYFGSQFGLYSQRMLRDARWKYVFNATAEDELYDLASDPAELTNRITDPACAADLSRLRRRLIAWMEQAGDPLLNQWTRPLLEGARAK